MADVCTLGSFDCNDLSNSFVRYPIQAGAPQTTWQERESLHGVNRQARVRTSGLRQIVVPMTLEAASANAMRTLIDSLRAECAKAENTLVMARSGDSTQLAYKAVRQTQPSVPWDLLYTFNHAEFDLILTAEPFAYGAEVTLFGAVSKACPAVMDLSSMVGDYPAPLEITFASPSENIAALYMGLVPDLSFAPYVEAEAMSWSGGTTSTQADAAAHGGSKKRNISSSVALATYADTIAYKRGTYLPLFRVKTSANSARVGYGYGGSEYDYLELANTYFKTLPLDPVALPIVKTRTGTAANLQARYLQNTSGNADLDYVGMCPISWGFVSWVHPTSDAASLILGYDGTLYAGGVASPEYKTGGPLYGFRTDRLCIFADDANGSEDSLTANVTIKYVPRYAQ